MYIKNAQNSVNFSIKRLITIKSKMRLKSKMFCTDNLRHKNNFKHLKESATIIDLNLLPNY